eukprot:10928573-Heterocapsa_arctica.AAC.1
MNWSMENTKFLKLYVEQGRLAPQAVEAQMSEKSVEHMECIVLQSEVPHARTCVRPEMDGAEITPTDIVSGCGQKTCITCSATDTTSGFKKEDFPINKS